MKGAYGMNRVDGESKESVYGRSDMSGMGEGTCHRVVENVKHSTMG